MKTKNRVAVYIDGFNLYHAIDDLNYVFNKSGKKQGLKPTNQHCHYLKWVNLWTLSESFLRDYQQLVAVNYFSAYATWKPAHLSRHRLYVKALESVGVNVVLGEFKPRKLKCNSCQTSWTTHEEKKSDVTAAVELVADGLLDKYDDAFLVTADSDLIPAVNRITTECPKKNIIVVSPPKRWNHSRGLKPKFTITRGKIDRNLFPEDVVDADSNLVCKRPSEYNP